MFLFRSFSVNQRFVFAEKVFTVDSEILIETSLIFDQKWSFLVTSIKMVKFKSSYFSRMLYDACRMIKIGNHLVILRIQMKVHYYFILPNFYFVERYKIYIRCMMMMVVMLCEMGENKIKCVYVMKDVTRPHHLFLVFSFPCCLFLNFEKKE